MSIIAEKRTVSLPPEQARYIDGLVASGGYASASEVVRAGLRALQERDAAVTEWLRNQVVPVHDAMMANPERALSAEQVADNLRPYHSGQEGKDQSVTKHRSYSKIKG